VNNYKGYHVHLLQSLLVLKRKVLLKFLKKLLISILIIVLALVLIGYFIFRPSYDEVARVTSPNGNYDAVLIELNGGATTSFSYEVYITKKNKNLRFKSSVANFYEAVRSDNAYGVNLIWNNQETLTIQYLTAKESTLSSEYVKIDDEIINIKLKSGINDPTAPNGGMLYNKELTKHRSQ